MNVVLINDNAFINGGASNVALTEAKLLAELGHSVHLLTAVGPLEPDLKGVTNLHVHLLNIADINFDSNRLRSIVLGLWNPHTYKYMKELLQSLPPRDTVIHAHSWTRALTSSAMKAALDSDKPVVVTLHDYLLGCPQGTFFNQHQSRPCSLKPMGLSCLTTNCDATSYSHKLWRSVRKLVQDNAAGVPKKIENYIYVSHSSLQMLKPYLPVRANFYHLPNPICVSRQEPAPVDRSAIFCFAGRFVPEKGALLFAEAAQAQGVATRFIGDGSQRDQILRINPSAEMSGWLSSTETLKAFSNSRALVFPSLWNEVLGLTVLEAAAQGLPSIVPTGCGAEESVIDGVTGFHFRIGDVQDLAAKIGLMKDPTVAATLGRAAYQKFWSTLEWSEKAHAQKLESIYQHMLVS